MNLSLPKLESTKKEWLIILGAAAVLIAIPLTVILLRRYQETRIWALEAGQIVDGSVKITNIHAHGFTVSWATVGESTGVLQWGPAGQPLAQASHDDRAGDAGPNFTSSTHYVTLPNPPGYDGEHPLFREPGQAFEFIILSGDGKFYGGTFDGVFTVEGVADGSTPVTVITGPELYNPPLYTSKNLLAPIFYRHWPSGMPGTSEWSVIHLENPHDQDVSFTLEFTGYERTAPSEWSSFSVERTVNSKRFYNTQTDEEFHTLFASWGDVRGYVQISSNLPLVGTLRHEFLEETGQESRLNPIKYVVNAPLLVSEEFSSTKLVFTHFVRDWYSHTAGWSYWSDLLLTNSGSEGATFTLNFYGTDKRVPPADRQKVTLTVGPKTLPAGRIYDSHDDPDLNALGGFLGYVVVESDQPVSGYLRDTWRDGAGKDDPVVVVSDVTAVPDTSQFASQTLTAPLFMRHWPSGMPGVTQWTVVQLGNSAGTDATVNLEFVGQTLSGQAVAVEAQRTVPAQGYYNTIDDAALHELMASKGDLIGYLKFTSSQPLFGLLRQEFVSAATGEAGSRYDPLKMVINSPYTLSKHFSGTRLLAPLFANNWHAQMGTGRSYWTDVHLVNDTGSEAQVNFKFYGQNKSGASVVREVSKTVAPRSFYNSHNDTAFDVLGDFLGFLEIESTQPVTAYLRDNWVEGATRTGEVLMAADLFAINRGGMDQEMRCHFSTPTQPDTTPTEAVAPGCPDPVFGEVQRSEGTAAPGTIVYLHLKDGNGQDSPGQAAPLSAITGSDGRYVIDLGNARTRDRSQYFAYDRYNNDLEDVFAEGGVHGQASLSNNPTSNDEPIPTLILNHPPVIEPIPDQTIPEGELYTYQVVASDPDGDQLTFGYELPVGASGSSTGVFYWEDPTPEGSVHNVRVWVEDGKGGYAEERFTLTIGPPVAPPVVVALVEIEPPGPLTLNVGGTVNFVAQAYDSDHNPIDAGVTYAWSVTGNIGTVNPSSGQSTTFTADTPGSGTVKVIATADGSSASAEAAVTVVESLDCEDSRIAPASFTIAPGGTRALTASAVGGSGNFSYAWSAVDAAGDPAGSFLDDGDDNPATTIWQAPADATDGQQFNIWVRITDNATGSVCATPRQSATATIEVPGPTLHHVTITPSSKTLLVGQTQSFTAQAYDANNNPIASGLTYAWSVTGNIGTVNPSSGQSSTFTATTAGSGTVNVTATLGTETASAQATVTVVNPLTCAVSPETFTLAPGESKNLTVSVSGGSTDKTIAWTKTGGDFVGATNTANVEWRSPTNATSGQTFTITATVTDNAAPQTCSDSSTATIQVVAPLTLDISLWMQGRSAVAKQPRGSSGAASVFARQSGQTTKLWEVTDLLVGADGKKSGVELQGLSVGSAYEFLLKGYINLTVKKAKTLVEGANSLDFGTLLTGDLRSPADDQVNSLDNDILLTGWQQTWNAPQACNGANQTYADCKPADFNLDSKVNSIDHDYIFSNWGKSGDK